MRSTLDGARPVARRKRPRFALDAEWLEADGLGGFASGTVGGFRTRRYHALLLTATTPPTGRVLLVHGFDAWVETPHGRFPISTQHYTPDLQHPDGVRHLVDFEYEPWPRWIFELDDGTRVEQQLCARHGQPLVAVWWRLITPKPDVRLVLRPFLSGRDFHSLHHENGGFRFVPGVDGQHLWWSTYPGIPAVRVVTNASYEHAPEWYRNFLYREERARGLDHVEDAASPGILRWNLTSGEAALLVGTEGWTLNGHRDALDILHALRTAERERRLQLGSTWHRAADAYLVRRGKGRSIVAGYPWFTDWGRDTFIALRGICVATGRVDAATEILAEWAASVSRGMLPNRFADSGEVPEFNSVDASLWYVIAVHDLVQELARSGRRLASDVEQQLLNAIHAILEGYEGGTRFGIRADSDGLLVAGEPGWQLTWMDAKVGDHVVTPRIGKPVEVQALWLNALWIAMTSAGTSSPPGTTNVPDPRWAGLFERGRASFQRRFWNAERRCLYDVVDVDQVPGRVDAALRPNQILAVGGLPLVLLNDGHARAVVDAVESHLWTALGPRSLAPGEAGYVGHYEGGVFERDHAYHQGTVWPWLAGPFVEAWVRVRGATPEVKREARERFLEPLQRHLDTAGLGHISEIADAEAPHTPRGCPFQAWSLGEFLRLDKRVLVTDHAALAETTSATPFELERRS